MKAILSIGLVLAGSMAMADSASDHAAIVSVIQALNDHSKPAATLFTADAADKAAELVSLGNVDRMPWSEQTAPKFGVRSIQFITADVALVDAENARFGSMIMKKSVPLLLVMKRVGSEWRIAAFRVMGSSDGASGVTF